MYSSKNFNYEYMWFVGYDIFDKLVWAPFEGITITNKISTQGIPTN